MPELFSSHAQELLAVAQDLARQLRHDTVGSDHLLLAILADARSLSAVLLRRVGFDRVAARRAVERLLKAGLAPTPPAHLARATELQFVLALATREADERRHDHVGGGHLLLAMLDCAESVGGSMLRAMGLTAPALGEALDHELGGSALPPLVAEAWASGVLRRAWDDAPDQDTAATGSAYILQGLLRWNACLAARALANLGITQAAVEDEIHRLLEQPPAPQPACHG